MREKYVIHKRLGETPLEALTRLRKAESIPDSVPMTYAGRLDPVAEGLLIVLTGEECKKKEDYLGLPKTYQAEILLGVSTDTYDLLGIPKAPGVIPASEPESRLLGLVQNYFQSHLGKHIQEYPPYSSKKVDGEQLHTHARKEAEVVLPSHEVSLDAYSELSVGIRTREEVADRVVHLTKIVTGDFRQTETCKAWNDIAENLPTELTTIKVTLAVSSGFYIRKLADDIGRELGVGACLYSLVRTKIGEYNGADFQI